MSNMNGGSVLFQKHTYRNAFFMMKTGTITAAVPFHSLKFQHMWRLLNNIFGENHVQAIEDFVLFYL